MNMARPSRHYYHMHKQLLITSLNYWKTKDVTAKNWTTTIHNRMHNNKKHMHYSFR